MAAITFPNYTQIPSRLSLPVLFMVAPGVWRNICPLATSNQTPRLLGITKGLNPRAWLKEYGYVIAVGSFVGFVILRVSRTATSSSGTPSSEKVM